MITNRTKVRVRYEEVDRMGYLHHGKYAAYFEIGRTELIRTLGLTYKELEDKGFILPLSDLHVDFKKPALYDELLTITTSLKEFSGIRLIFEYILSNETKEIICNGYTTLAFVNAKSRKPTRAPDFFMELIKNYKLSN